MPYVLNGTEGRIEITSRGIRHDIRTRVDPIGQQPVINHQQHPAEGRFVRNGTCVMLHWPNPPSSEPEAGDADPTSDEDDDLEEIDPSEQRSPSSMLVRAKQRFLQIADDFTFLNPHLRLTVNWHGERSTVEPTDAAHPKWRPNLPTCAHWYKPEQLGRLIAAYICHQRDDGRDRTVREFVAEFAGLSSTGKQKQVLTAAGLARAKLSELADDNGLILPKVEGLLRAMQAQSRPVKPAALGAIGRSSNAGLPLLVARCGRSSSARNQGSKTAGRGLWRRHSPDSRRDTPRRLITGVNWSPGILNPFRELGAFGLSLDGVLERQWAGRDEPVLVLLHMACPRVGFADRGKSSVVVED